MASLLKQIRAGVASGLLLGAGLAAAPAAAQTYSDARAVEAELRVLDYELQAELADCNEGYFDRSDRLGRTLAVGPEVRACVAEANFEHSYDSYRILSRAGFFNQAARQLEDAIQRGHIVDRANYEAGMAQCNGRQIDGFSRRNQDLGDIFRGSARQQQCAAGVRADYARDQSRRIRWESREREGLARSMSRSR